LVFIGWKIVGGSCIKKEIVGLYLEVIFVRDNIYIYIYVYLKKGLNM
jgi:hypothetical protein